MLSTCLALCACHFTTDACHRRIRFAQSTLTAHTPFSSARQSLSASKATASARGCCRKPPAPHPPARPRSAAGVAHSGRSHRRPSFVQLSPQGTVSCSLSAPPTTLSSMCDLCITRCFAWSSGWFFGPELSMLSHTQPLPDGLC